MNIPPRAQVYELLDSIPSNVTEMKLPNYKAIVTQLFTWHKWQGMIDFS